MACLFATTVLAEHCIMVIMSSQPNFASVIANPGFKYLWINQVLIQLAYNTLNFALIIWVFKLTDSHFAVAALLLSVYLPSFIFGLAAGVLVDLADKRKVILIINLLFALSFLIFIFIKDIYWLILLNTFFINTLAQFFIPTESSSIPMLVPKKELLIANSLFSLTLYGAFMIGFSVAGPIMGNFGINAVFLLGIFCMVLAWACSLNLSSIRVIRKEKLADFLRLAGISKLIFFTISEIQLAFNFIRGKLNVLVAIGIMATVQGVIGILAVLISSYMERVLHIHATDASYVLMIPLGLGMISGAFLIGKFASHYPKRLLVVPGIITTGLIFVMMGITPTVAAYMQAIDLPLDIPKLRFFANVPTLSKVFAGGAFLLGLAAVSIIVPAQTIIQEDTDERIRGKIFAVLIVMMNVFAAVPVVLAGALADLFGVTPIFAGMGALIFSIGVIALAPQMFFDKQQLSFRLREFLGLDHWEG